MAERTGLEPATPGVTGRYSNQLNYRSASIRAFALNLQPDGVIRCCASKNGGWYWDRTSDPRLVRAMLSQLS